MLEQADNLNPQTETIEVEPIVLTPPAQDATTFAAQPENGDTVFAMPPTDNNDTVFAMPPTDNNDAVFAMPPLEAQQTQTAQTATDGQQTTHNGRTPEEQAEIDNEIESIEAQVNEILTKETITPLDEQILPILQERLETLLNGNAAETSEPTVDATTEKPTDDATTDANIFVMPPVDDHQAFVVPPAETPASEPLSAQDDPIILAPPVETPVDDRQAEEPAEQSTIILAPPVTPTEQPTAETAQQPQNEQAIEQSTEPQVETTAQPEVAVQAEQSVEPQVETTAQPEVTAQAEQTVEPQVETMEQPEVAGQAERPTEPEPVEMQAIVVETPVSMQSQSKTATAEQTPPALPTVEWEREAVRAKESLLEYLRNHKTEEPPQPEKKVDDDRPSQAEIDELKARLDEMMARGAFDEMRRHEPKHDDRRRYDDAHDDRRQTGDGRDVRRDALQDRRREIRRADDRRRTDDRRDERDDRDDRRYDRYYDDRELSRTEKSTLLDDILRQWFTTEVAEKFRNAFDDRDRRDDRRDARHSDDRDYDRDRDRYDERDRRDEPKEIRPEMVTVSEPTPLSGLIPLGQNLYFNPDDGKAYFVAPLNSMQGIPPFGTPQQKKTVKRPTPKKAARPARAARPTRPRSARPMRASRSRRPMRPRRPMGRRY